MNESWSNNLHFGKVCAAAPERNILSFFSYTLSSCLLNFSTYFFKYSAKKEDNTILGPFSTCEKKSHKIKKEDIALAESDIYDVYQSNVQEKLKF